MKKFLMILSVATTVTFSLSKAHAFNDDLFDPIEPSQAFDVAAKLMGYEANNKFLEHSKHDGHITKIEVSVGKHQENDFGDYFARVFVRSNSLHRSPGICEVRLHIFRDFLRMRMPDTTILEDFDLGNGPQQTLAEVKSVNCKDIEN